MSELQRLFFDVSYTRTQRGTVGISRTVRRLLAALQDASTQQGWLCSAVAFNTAGFRRIPSGGDGPAGGESTDHRLGARLLRTMSGGAVRRIVSACVPLPLLNRTWSGYNRRTFNALSADAQPLAFRPGDWLVLADQSWNYPAWIASQRASEQGARVILVIYDLIPLRCPQFCNRLFTLVFSHWLQHMLGAVDAVMCISRSTEQDLRAYCTSAGWTMPAVAHFRLGSDPFVVAGQQQVRSAVSEFLSKGAPAFAAIGSFEPRKNYGFLLDTFEELWAEGHHMRLLVAGRRNEESHALIERFRRHPQTGQRLLCLFDANDAEVAHIYAHCRALVFPSMAEGFGLPLVEARAQGCPVIASELPVFHELADAGVSFYPKDSIEGLEALVLAHAAVDRRTMVGAMPAFTWRDSVEQLLKTVTVVLDPPAGP